MGEKTIDIGTLLNDCATGDATQAGNTTALTGFQSITDLEINAVLPSAGNLSDDDLFIELEPETPQDGSRISFKLTDCQINNNQPTDYGLKTSVSVKINCYFNDGKIFPVYEKFFMNPGEPVNGRLKAFCQDLFGAYNLQRANLKDLIGYEGTALITYSLAKDNVTKWPHLSNFEPLS
jgi:hypothetical protein